MANELPLDPVRKGVRTPAAKQMRSCPVIQAKHLFSLPELPGSRRAGRKMTGRALLCFKRPLGQPYMSLTIALLRQEGACRCIHLCSLRMRKQQLETKSHVIESIRKSAVFQSLPERLRRLLRSGYRLLTPPSVEASPAPEAVAGLNDATQVPALATHLYRAILERPASPGEIQAWRNEVQASRITLAGMVGAIVDSSEAASVRERAKLIPEVSNGRFIQYAFEFLHDRSPMVSEVAQWDHLLRRQDAQRTQLVLQLFVHRANVALTDAGNAPAHDPGLAPWLGTNKFISIKEWQEKASSLGETYPPVRPKRYASLRTSKKPEILVSAIASLYRGGEYIDQFLENITSQSIFADQCELIIIDADSPENESETIARYMERFPNIVYHRAPTRIGIYEAWNLGVSMARGRYLTNTNLDDLRRFDSFERQAEILEKFSFVDVVYQDFYYSFEGKASFAKSAAVGYKSEVPVVTPYNLMLSNSPHNAPMWRRTLHDEMGMFDTSFRSAGDYEFWLRCIQAGKTFYKVNDPHVVYFVNPEGLSTRPDTRGIEEANRITKRHGRKLLSPWLLSSDEELVAELSRLAGKQLEVEEPELAASDWRYTAAQRALRLHSIASRAGSHS